jgi:hypothetical protein
LNQYTSPGRMVASGYVRRIALSIPGPLAEMCAATIRPVAS